MWNPSKQLVQIHEKPNKNRSSQLDTCWKHVRPSISRCRPERDMYAEHLLGGFLASTRVPQGPSARRLDQGLAAEGTWRTTLNVGKSASHRTILVWMVLRSLSTVFGPSRRYGWLRLDFFYTCWCPGGPRGMSLKLWSSSWRVEPHWQPLKKNILNQSKTYSENNSDPLDILL